MPVFGIRTSRFRYQDNDWHTLRKVSYRRLPKFVFDYIDGGAGAELCLRRNRMAIDDIQITPRVLGGVNDVKARHKLFGKPVSAPIVLAPMGLTELIRPDGPLALARACEQADIPFALSSATALGAGFFNQIKPPWYQLYIYDPGIINEQIDYVSALGCETLIITVDLPVGGRRLRDIKNEFSPDVGLKMMAQASVRPLWLLHRMLGYKGVSRPNLDKRLRSRSLHALSWVDLENIRDLWKGTLIVKGILDSDDALRCVNMGVDGLVISNHGGRQFDAAPSPFSVLPEISKAVDNRATILVDGGINCGEDIVKALALGADGILLGRMALYALASGGERRVYELLCDLKSQITVAMKLLGSEDVDALRLLRLIKPPLPLNDRAM